MNKTEQKEAGTALKPVDEGTDAAPAVVSTPPLAAPAAQPAQQPPLVTRSEQIDKLASALALAQGEFPTIKKDSVVDFEGKKGRVNYTYANLAAIVAAIKPVMTKHKLAVSQFPVRCKGGMHITTLLMHHTGQFLQSTFSLEMVSNDVKEAGTVVTYGRRYALAAILNIVTDEDTDGPPVDEKKLAKLYQQLYTAGTKAGGTHKQVLDWLKTRYGIKESAKEMGIKQLEEAISILSAKAKKKNTRRGKKAAKGAAKPAAKPAGKEDSGGQEQGS